MVVYVTPRPNNRRGCPNCGSYPLRVDWPEGTLDFRAHCCGIALEVDSHTLIEILPETFKGDRR